VATETVGQEELETQSLTISKQAGALIIRDQGSYNQAVEMLKAVKSMRKKWCDYFEPLREKAYSAYKEVLDKLKEGDRPLEVAERSLKHSLLTWDEAQRREQERLQAEAQRKAEADEEARRAQLAFEMEQDGAEEAAIEEVVLAPVVTVAQHVAPTYQKAAGISTRENWKARVTDVKKLCKAIGAGKFKFDPADEQKLADFLAGLLKDRASADKSTLCIPGVEAYNDPVIAGRF
jgi:gas vesicle protein